MSLEYEKIKFVLHNANITFFVHFLGDKQAEKYDALSLIIIELDHNERKSSGAPPVPGTEYPKSSVELVTVGHDGYNRRWVTKRAQYSDRIWPGSHNPNFLLSGQLSGDQMVYSTDHQIFL